jgi:hypothetical protein
MKIYDYCLDKENLEIFPGEIWQNSNVVFHGTSEYHSQQIEQLGFVPSKSPFDLDDARELISLLKRPEISGFDEPRAMGMKVSETLNNYVWGIEKNVLKLSFAYLSYLSVFFSVGHSKGGQAFGNIREAKTIIQRATNANPNVETLITEPIRRLFELENTIANANGIVYAICLESPYIGISEEYGTIHSAKSISVEKIIGKITLPNDTNTIEFSFKVAKEKNNKKNLKRDHLGTKLNRMTNSNEEEW